MSKPATEPREDVVVAPAPNNHWRFTKSLSFDGVAIISACVYCSLWFGSLKETVRNHTEILKHHEQLLETLAAAVKIQEQNIAVLQAIVNERAKKP